MGTSSIDRGNRMFVVQMLPVALFDQDRKIVVAFYRRFYPQSVDQIKGEKLALPNGLVEKFLLDVGPGRSGIRLRLIGGDGGLLHWRYYENGLRRGDGGYLLFQESDGLAVFLEVDFVAADVTDNA